MANRQQILASADRGPIYLPQTLRHLGTGNSTRPQVWGGTFNFCSDSATAEAHGESVFYVYRTEENGIEGRAECEAGGFEWRNAQWNFDHIGNALQSVLVIFTYNGWQNILFHAINAR